MQGFSPVISPLDIKIPDDGERAAAEVRFVSRWLVVVLFTSIFLQRFALPIAPDGLAFNLLVTTLAVAVRLGLSVRIGDPPMRGLEELPWQLLAAAVVSASFAVANYAPRRTLPAAALADDLRADLGEALHEHLTRREVRCTQQRVAELLRTGLHPEPSGDWPALPWPPF